MEIKLKPIFLSGIVAGFLLVLGEGILNAMFLRQEWHDLNQQLGLGEPSQIIVTLVLIKLLVLGFAIMWLYEVVSHKFGKSNKSALIAGFFIGLLIWGWVLAGLLMAGYVNNSIAIPTFFWGMVELPVITVISSKVFNKIST